MANILGTSCFRRRATFIRSAVARELERGTITGCVECLWQAQRRPVRRFLL